LERAARVIVAVCWGILCTVLGKGSDLSYLASQGRVLKWEIEWEIGPISHFVLVGGVLFTLSRLTLYLE
jgi:hypothetical protein